ncbi:MAG: hypothetical protein NTZ18_02555 [Candidatus Komeilibacteria bacterium]|nr:hypothetical protein [Candidatus Komeilibacteria bacterium]
MHRIIVRIANDEIPIGDKIYLPWEEAQVVLVEYHNGPNRLAILYRRKDDRVVVAKVLPSIRLGDLCFEAIRQQLIGYHQGLIDIGMPISTGIKFIEEPLGDSFVQLEDYGGQTVSQAIQEMSFHEAKPILWALLRDCISPLFRAIRKDDDSSMLYIGLDAALRNFVFFGGVSITIRMIDLFPPKLWSAESGYTLEKPEPTDETVKNLGIQRHFDLGVMVFTLWTHIVRANPILGLPAIVLIKSFLSEYDQQALIRRIEDLIGSIQPGLKDLQSIHETLKSFDFHGYHGLRAIACLVAASRRDSRILLERFFKKTHFQSRPLTLAEIEEAKGLILEIAQLPKR